MAKVMKHRYCKQMFPNIMSKVEVYNIDFFITLNSLPLC